MYDIRNHLVLPFGTAPEASKKALTESYGYDWETDAFKPLPVTVADLAKMFDGTKFFGHFESNLLTTLMDISEGSPTHDNAKARMMMATGSEQRRCWPNLPKGHASSRRLRAPVLF